MNDSPNVPEARPLQFLSGETYTGYEIFGNVALAKKLYLLLGKTTESINGSIHEVYTREQMQQARQLIYWPREGIAEEMVNAETKLPIPLILCVNENL